MKSHKVAYIYNQQIYDYQYAPQHPMKPKRIKMTQSLIENYKLFREMHIYQPSKATNQIFSKFHDTQYIKYLQKFVNPQVQQIIKPFQKFQNQKNNFNNNTKSFRINARDCPQFPGLYNFCQIPVGGSLNCAQLLIQQDFDVAINWAGGFHHGKKKCASGFCFINDIVICILQLLKVYQRVLYIDIDVHHGDGVAQAFFCTNRVMKISFHQFQQCFFPGTGDLTQIGQGLGQYYCVNVPMKAGMDDINYLQIFKKITDEAIKIFRPQSIVVQCGADSLSKDKLGNFNLSIKGHGNCIKHILSHRIKTIFLGGGGYTIQNVARCWAYETSVILGKQLSESIPENDNFYHQYAKDNYRLHFNIQNKLNQNSRQHLQKVQSLVLQNLRKINTFFNFEVNGNINSQYQKKQFVEVQLIDKIRKCRKRK